ncbi:ATP-binding protein [Chitinophaga rhizosphaerae]|uniref:ATP-binding protein n=1 Tax=Chitinophaga rhizosphaerae TaxID=1864947 RepID=UPI000F80875D|nr:ATP-binding protein [Chitinophaga rhizosphaerae]
MLKTSNIKPPRASGNGLQEPFLVHTLEFLKAFTTARLEAHFRQTPFARPDAPVPAESDDSSFARYVRHAELASEELLLLACALAPGVVAGFFDNLVQSYLPQGGEFPEFGGMKGNHHRGTLPTGETAMFLLAGNDAGLRLRLLPLFGDGSYLFRSRILSLEPVRAGEPALSGRLMADPEYAEVFMTGHIARPKLSMQFPAEYIQTLLEWDDLVLPDGVRSQIRELESWITHQGALMEDWNMGRKLKPGYRALFYGPPGTGKTLTATLLGKYTGRDVYRVDLSSVVSKYIGETEKNLSALFDKAEDKSWILFFDEADALFGKRTGVRDAHDKYANQEVSYLLQRIESHAGLTILASNFKNNMDDAFIRRFNSIIYFPPPRAEDRLLLWKKAFPVAAKLQKDVDLKAIAEQFELTGSHILNVVQYVCLQALDRGSPQIGHADVLRGVKRELEKEGK